MHFSLFLSSREPSQALLVSSQGGDGGNGQEKGLLSLDPWGDK